VRGAGEVIDCGEAGLVWTENWQENKLMRLEKEINY
jgi:hypothetical protein